VALGFAVNIKPAEPDGQDLNGAALGGKSVECRTPSRESGSRQYRAGVVTAAITNVSTMTASDYQLQVSMARIIH